MPPSSRKDSAGFTLLEILIALVVLALSVGALFMAVSQGASHHMAASRQARLAAHAQSALDLMMAAPPALGARAGDRFEDGFAWEGRIELVAGAKPASGLIPVTVSVTVTAPEEMGGAPMTLETIRLLPLEGAR